MKRSMPPRPHTPLRKRLLIAMQGRRTRLLQARAVGDVDDRPSLLRRVFAPGWVNLLPEVAGEEGIDRKLALEWELVLQARHLPCRLRKVEADQWGVFVQPWFLDRAAGELRLYQEENRPVPQPPVLPPPRPGELGPTLALMVCLVTFFAWYVTPHPSLNMYESRWLAAGSAHAGAIIEGQWWRLMTALTLHSGGPHLVGNVVIGGAFIVLTCRLLGSGLSWILVLASGVLGNLVNAIVLGPDHNSIGFSTAVFGAAGVLAGSRIAEGREQGLYRVLVPVGGGLGLLAMLGTGGEHTDLGAHLFGFGAGVILGLPCGLLVMRKGRPGPVADAVMLGLAFALPVAGWWLALR